MATIPLTLVGKSFTDGNGNTTFVGQAFTTGLQIGGGPMPGGPPPGTWGGSGVGDYIDAGLPGPQPGQPPRLWGPITYPDQGLPGPQPPFPKPPGAGPGQWRWVYSPFYGWVLDPGAGGKPQPPGGNGGQPGQPPYPDQSLPEPQPHPDQSLPEPQTT